MNTDSEIESYLCNYGSMNPGWPPEGDAESTE